jgi:putative flippase GtrA
LKAKIAGALRDSKQLRFLIVGGLNFAWGLASYPVLYFLLAGLQLHYMVILAIAYVINTVVAYLTQKYVVFKTVGNFRKEFLPFLALQAAIFAANSLVLPIIVETSQASPVVVQTAFALCLAVISFVFHDKITFKPRAN